MGTKPPNKRKSQKQSSTSAISRLLSIGKMGLDLAKSEAEYHLQKNIERSKTLEKLGTQIKQMQTITRTLGEMKGAVMKLGQMLSLYDIPGLPPEVRDILTGLQKQSPALPFEQMAEVIVEDLPHFFEKVTLDSEKPLAAASIGQVYRGKLNTGEPLAIKVQIPEIEKIMKSDLKNLNILAKVFSPWVSQKELKAVLEELKIHLMNECDYVKEAANVTWFNETYQNHPALRFPRVFPNLSSKRVITMSFMEGLDIYDWLKQTPTQAQRDKLTFHLADFYFHQIFKHGRAHTDPQFGNYLFQPHDHCITVLDFGSVKTFNPVFIHNLIVFLNDCIHMDFERLHQGYLALGLVTGRDQAKLGQFLDEYIRIASEVYSRDRYQYGEYHVIHNILKTLPNIFKQKKIHVPTDFVLLDRVVAGLYFFAEKVKASVPIRKLIQTYVIESSAAGQNYQMHGRTQGG
jgi:predicted unusual protein kinase regulating ubiquinone biosynthesis (AarF/ABC1/UbiB family)